MVRKAIAEKGMVYLTNRQICAVLDGLWAAGYLIVEEETPTDERP